MTSGPTPQQVVEAEVTVLLDRLLAAARDGRGLHLHRKEATLAAAVVACARELADTDAIIHTLTKQEEEQEPRN